MCAYSRVVHLNGDANRLLLQTANHVAASQYSMLIRYDEQKHSANSRKQFANARDNEIPKLVSRKDPGTKITAQYNSGVQKDIHEHTSNFIS